MRTTTWIGGLLACAAALLAAPAQAGTSIHLSVGTPGYYVQPGYGYGQPSYVYSEPSHVYSPPGYVYTQPGYVYTQPNHHYGSRHHGDRYQRRYRDQDGDGIPNRYDRDRDGDGVPNRYDRRPNNPYRY